MSFFEGLTPEALPLTPVSDSTVDAEAWVAVVIALVVAPTTLRLWQRFTEGLMRRSNNQPAIERTVGERINQVTALLLSFLAWGILLYCTAFRMRYGAMTYTPGSGVAITALACLAAYAIQTAGYLTVGFAFTTGVNTRVWVRSLNVVQSMQGLFIMLPALGALLYPSAAIWFMGAGATIYLLFRILLWIKSFRIFYTGPFSIFYFFLYLCTLETVPLLLPVGVALFIC